MRQFRPVVYVNKLIELHVSTTDSSTSKGIELIENLDWDRMHPHEGFTFELCAGICDKNKAAIETIKEEILEECGYDVDIQNIHKISHARSVGLFGAVHTIFYTEVTDQLKTAPGGGNADEGEFIELFELPVSSIREFINDYNNEKPLGVEYGLKWFLYEREEYFKNKN